MRGAQREVGALDRVHRSAGREAAERARQLDRVGDPEGVGGGPQLRRRAAARRAASNQRSVPGGAADAAASTTTTSSRAGPRVEQPRRRRPRARRPPARARDRRAPRASSPRHAVADADDERHPRSIVERAGSASRRRCTGRSCARPARSGGCSSSSAQRRAWRSTKRAQALLDAGLVLRASAGRSARRGSCRRRRSRSGARAGRAAPRSSRARRRARRHVDRRRRRAARRRRSAAAPRRRRTRISTARTTMLRNGLRHDRLRGRRRRPPARAAGSSRSRLSA